jgi:hypothetical protein
MMPAARTDRGAVRIKNRMYCMTGPLQTSTLNSAPTRSGNLAIEVHLTFDLHVQPL